MAQRVMMELEARHPLSDRPAAVHSSGRPFRVLVVEDEGLTALNFCRILQAAGFEVAGVAATALAAIRLAGETAPDVILMDVRLSGQPDGITAAEEIRRRYGHVVIFTTGNGDTTTLARMRRVSPAHILLKPIADTMLRAAVESACHTFAE